MLILAAPADLADSGVFSSKQRAVIDVCTTLGQNKQDISMCCDKARGNTITAGETASLVYLCCLGYFNDVQLNYMSKITFQLVLHIVMTSNPEELRKEAQFISQCQDSPGGKMTVQDYVGWRFGSQTAAACRTTSKKWWQSAFLPIIFELWHFKLETLKTLKQKQNKQKYILNLVM